MVGPSLRKQQKESEMMLKEGISGGSRLNLYT